MPVAIQKPNAESKTDKLMKMLQMGQSLFGIASNAAQLKMAGDAEDRAEEKFEMEKGKFQREEEVAKASADASSPLSQAARESYKQVGLKVPETASKAQLEQQYGPLAQYVLQQQKQKGDLQIASAKAGLAKGMRKTLNPETGEIELTSAKQLPADKVLLVNQANAIPNMLQDISGTIEQNKDLFGPIRGRIGSMNPYDEQAQTVDAQLRAASQSFGRYMESGVLRKEDEEKYRKMFPQLGDTPELAANKLTIVDRLLKSKQKSDLEALEQSGFDVAGLRKGSSSGQVPDLPKSLRKKGDGEGMVNEAFAGDGPPQIRVTEDGVTYKKTKGGWERF